MQMKRTLLAIAIGAISAGLAGGALAQATENDAANDEQQEQLLDNQEVQGGQEARSGDQDDAATDGQDTDTDTATDEGDADLNDLDAESELPEEGDDAEDYEAIDDDLEGDQVDEDAGQDADADAGQDDDAMQADAAEQADDDAMQADTAGQPGDAVAQDETAAQPGAAGEADQTGQAGAADGFAATGPADVGQGAQLHDSLSGLMVSEVQGMTVVNQNGDNLGRVENVVRHDDAGDLHVIITVGGFWIFGGSEVALPLADMQLEGEQLVLQDIIGEDELDGMANDYDEDRYSDVDGNLMLSEAAGR